MGLRAPPLVDSSDTGNAARDVCIPFGAKLCVTSAEGWAQA